MKDVYEVLRQKEMEIVRVQNEVEALHLVIPLLAEEGDRVQYGQTSPPLPSQLRGTGTAGEKRWP